MVLLHSQFSARMAKTESTAVNQLIASVSTKPLGAEPAADLFASPKPTRLSSTIPPIAPIAADVAPLPRRRAPSGTSKHALPQIPPPVRATTVPPTGMRTIPPIAVPKGTQPGEKPASMPKLPAPTRASGTLPPPIRTSAAIPAVPPPRPLPAPARTSQPSISPVAAPFEAPVVAKPAPAPTKRTSGGNPLVARPITVDAPGDAVAGENWFEASIGIDRVDIDVTWNRQRVEASSKKQLAKKLALPIGGLVVVGVALGAYLAMRGDGGTARHVAAPKAPDIAQKAPEVQTPAPAPTHESTNAATATAGATQPEPPVKAEVVGGTAPAAPVGGSLAGAAAPAPVAAPTPALAPAQTDSEVREVKTTRGVVKLVDVRIDSKPAGATVMLVDNGKSSFLGNAPVVASVDPTHSYDVVFTLEGRSSQMVHFDPGKTHRLEATLHHGSAAAKSAPVAAPAPAPRKVAAKAAAPAPKGELADPGFDDPAPQPKATAETRASTGMGMLMVSSKPPCSIVVDGKETGLSTPQKAMPLSAGAHKITFVNATENINKTVEISITADKSTRLIQNLLNH